MNRFIFKTTIALFALATSLPAGQAPGIIGYWVTIDDNTGDTLSVVEIFPEGNTLSGRVIQVFLRPHQGTDGRCQRCPGKQKNAALTGLKIFWGLQAKEGVWRDGKLLHPPDGKIYSLSLERQDQDRLMLQVKGGLFGLFRRNRQLRRRYPGRETGLSGEWFLWDERFHQASALLRLINRSGELSAVLLKSYLLPDEGPDARCVACKGALHMRKIAGLKILSGLRPASQDKWRNGRILDPGNGKIYKCTIWLESGNRLKVRGYLGPFFRTQTWYRTSEQRASLRQTG